MAVAISCCASNLTVNFYTIIVGRAGEAVSVFNLDAPQLINKKLCLEKINISEGACGQLCQGGE